MTPIHTPTVVAVAHALAVPETRRKVEKQVPYPGVDTFYDLFEVRNELFEVPHRLKQARRELFEGQRVLEQVRQDLFGIQSELKQVPHALFEALNRQRSRRLEQFTDI